jgi:hypothetical protein
MEQSQGFANLEKMIEADLAEINLSAFDQLLKQLQEDEHITATEHIYLLMKMTMK